MTDTKKAVLTGGLLLLGYILYKTGLIYNVPVFVGLVVVYAIVLYVLWIR